MQLCAETQLLAPKWECSLPEEVFSKAQRSSYSSNLLKLLQRNYRMYLVFEHRGQTVLKREMEHMVINSRKLWCRVVISKQPGWGRHRNHELSPKGLINKANCTAAEENSIAHSDPRFSVAGIRLNWKERKLPQESARKTTGRVAPLPKMSLLHCWWECKLVQPLWRSVWRFL